MNITSFFSHKKASRKPFDPNRASLAERLLEDPYAGWGAVLAVSGLVALALIAASAEMFLESRSGNLPSASAAPTVSHRAAFDPSALSSLFGAFDQRAAASAQLEKGYDGPPDPSL